MDWEIIKHDDLPYGTWEMLDLNLDAATTIWKPLYSYKANKRCPDFQILLVGNCNIGKTLLINTLKNKQYKKEEYKSTLGITYEDLYFKNINNEIIKIRLYDSSGQHIYHSIVLSYIEYCDIILLIDADKNSIYQYDKIKTKTIFIKNPTY